MLCGRQHLVVKQTLSLIQHYEGQAIMSTERFFSFNGVNGTTGEYLMRPLELKDISQIALNQTFDPYELKALERKKRQFKGLENEFAPKEGVDPKNLAEAGWGVIFAHNTHPIIKEALKLLLDHRKEQATQKEERYYRETIYQPYEQKRKFLARHEASPKGPVDPAQMPYYLLIVGDPKQIPYSFQYQLDVEYAVGRIHFDTAQEYAEYARSVVDAETKKLLLPRHAGFFGVRHESQSIYPDATQFSADHLVEPLVEWMRQEGWYPNPKLKDKATKACLSQLLGGTETPALLFTASHGVVFDSSDPRQLRHQGALLCQDWPGGIPKDTEHYFSADDIGSDAQLWGLIAFHFACYGAGTPKEDEFTSYSIYPSQPPKIAPHAFVASLPKRLLSHPKGGALAVIGHVERAWGYSFLWEGKQGMNRQLTVFQSTLKRLMEGHPVGSAFEYFNGCYAEISTELNEELKEIRRNKNPNDEYLANLWIEHNDARNYVIIGDPAVRLCVGDNGSTEVNRIRESVIFSYPEPSPVPEVEEEEDDDDESVIQQSKDRLAHALKQFVATVYQAGDEQIKKQFKPALTFAESLLEVLNDLA